TVSRCRKIEMMSASPTAASAAATVITKNTNTCPSIPTARESATKARFTAFSISSMHRKSTIAFRRNTTPAVPIVNRIADRISDSVNTSHPPLGQEHRTDDRGEQQYRRQLERHHEIAEQRLRDRTHGVQLAERGIDRLLRAQRH